MMVAAKKGSQFLLQKFVNDYSDSLNQHILSSSSSLLAFLGGDMKITWKSPLVGEDYYEYRDDFLSAYYVEKEQASIVMQKIRQYWPKNGPVWDGIAVVEGKNEKKGLLLVEAKAHIDETISRIQATSPVSIEKIRKSILLAQEGFRSSAEIDPWLDEYYQLANRLTFLYLLNRKFAIPTWLVLANFVDDRSYKPTSLYTWLQHYQAVFQTLGIDSDSELLSKVITIFPAVT